MVLAHLIRAGFLSVIITQWPIHARERFAAAAGSSVLWCGGTPVIFPFNFQHDSFDDAQCGKPPLRQPAIMLSGHVSNHFARVSTLDVFDQEQHFEYVITERTLSSRW